MKKNYDVVMSLGYNCEVSFRIKDYLGKVDSYPFTWSYELDRDKFIESLDNLKDLFSTTHTAFPWGMIKCDKYQISFHAKENKDKFFNDDKENTEIVENSLVELKSRINHLIDKFYDLMKSDKRTLFLMKILNTDVEKDKDYIIKLFNKLNELYVSKNFTLVVVLQDNQYFNEIKKIESDRLKIRKIEEFADDSNTKLGGDRDGWNKVISEFVLKPETEEEIIVKQRNEEIKKIKQESKEYKKRRIKENLWDNKFYRGFIKILQKMGIIKLFKKIKK